MTTSNNSGWVPINKKKSDRSGSGGINNSFCHTGKGGGIDPTCSPDESGGASSGDSDKNKKKKPSDNSKKYAMEATIILGSNNWDIVDESGEGRQSVITMENQNHPGHVIYHESNGSWEHVGPPNDSGLHKFIGTGDTHRSLVDHLKDFHNQTQNTSNYIPINNAKDALGHDSEKKSDRGPKRVKDRSMWEDRKDANMYGTPAWHAKNMIDDVIAKSAKAETSGKWEDHVAAIEPHQDIAVLYSQAGDKDKKKHHEKQARYHRRRTKEIHLAEKGYHLGYGSGPGGR